MQKIKSSIKHVFKAVHHSIAGLRATYLSELAFRVELFLTPIIILFAFLIGQTLNEYVILIGSWFFVLFMELVNTVIETIINRISREHHKDSAKAKDIGSALVFIATIQAAIFWIIILINTLTSGAFT